MRKPDMKPDPRLLALLVHHDPTIKAQGRELAQSCGLADQPWIGVALLCCRVEREVRRPRVRLPDEFDDTLCGAPGAFTGKYTEKLVFLLTGSERHIARDGEGPGLLAAFEALLLILERRPWIVHVGRYLARSSRLHPCLSLYRRHCTTHHKHKRSAEQAAERARTAHRNDIHSDRWIYEARVFHYSSPPAVSGGLPGGTVDPVSSP